MYEPAQNIKNTIFVAIFLKWAIPSLFFLYFHIFNTVDSK